MAKVQLPVVITPTRAELAARCHRRHFLSDILGKARYVSPSLGMGTVMHTGFSSHWLYVRGDKTSDWHKSISEEWQKQKIEHEGLTLALAEAMMKHYESNALIAGPLTSQGDFKLVDVEQRFEIPLRDIKLSFQMDRVVYDKDQDWMVIVDSKTAGRLDAKWERQWETSVQMKLYRAGAKQVFGHVGRLDIVVEGVLKHVPSDLRYYVCPEWSDGLLAEAGHNAYVHAAMDRDLIEQSLKPSLIIPVQRNAQDKPETTMVPDVSTLEELAVRFTPVNYFDCFSYGIECPFRRICVADVDQRVAILRGEYFDVQDEGY